LVRDSIVVVMISLTFGKAMAILQRKVYTLSKPEVSSPMRSYAVSTATPEPLF